MITLEQKKQKIKEMEDEITKLEEKANNEKETKEIEEKYSQALQVEKKLKEQGIIKDDSNSDNDSSKDEDSTSTKKDENKDKESPKITRKQILGALLGKAGKPVVSKENIELAHSTMEKWLKDN